MTRLLGLGQLAGWLGAQGLRATDSLVVRLALRLVKCDQEFLKAYRRDIHFHTKFRVEGSAEDNRALLITNRAVQLAPRVSVEFDQRLRHIAQRDGLMPVEVLERALDAYEAFEAFNRAYEAFNRKAHPGQVPPK